MAACSAARAGAASTATGEGAAAPAMPVAVHEAPATAREVAVHGDDAIADYLEQAATRALAPQGWGPARERDSDWIGLDIDGARRCSPTAARPRAGEGTGHCRHRRVRPPARAARTGRHGTGLRRPRSASRTLAHAGARRGSPPSASRRCAWPTYPAWWSRARWPCWSTKRPTRCSRACARAQGADLAMKLGVNYPPARSSGWRPGDRRDVIRVLDALDADYRGERYRASPWLRRRAHSKPPNEVRRVPPRQVIEAGPYAVTDTEPPSSKPASRISRPHWVSFAGAGSCSVSLQHGA